MAFYYLRRGKVCWGENSEVSFMHVSAYNDAGVYIGDRDFARRLDRMGILPLKRNPDSKVCSIGKSMKDDKWYGWSHRGICGFKVGDIITKDGYLGKELKLADDFHIVNEIGAIEMARAFAESIS